MSVIVFNGRIKIEKGNNNEIRENIDYIYNVNKHIKWL